MQGAGPPQPGTETPAERAGIRGSGDPEPRVLKDGDGDDDQDGRCRTGAGEHAGPAVHCTVTSVPIGVMGQTTAALANGISTQPRLWGNP